MRRSFESRTAVEEELDSIVGTSVEGNELLQGVLDKCFFIHTGRAIQQLNRTKQVTFSSREEAMQFVFSGFFAREVALYNKVFAEGLMPE